jgi:heptosyltransferase-2
MDGTPALSPVKQPPSSVLEPRRILVRGVNWLGDAVMTTPALQRLRERFPEARITILTPEKLADLWLNHPAIDEVLPIKPGARVWRVGWTIRMWQFQKRAAEFEQGRGKSKGNVDASVARAFELFGLMGDLKRRPFDLGLALPNSPRAALELWLGRIPQRVGYARPWRNRFLTQALPSRMGQTKMHKRSSKEIQRLIQNAGPSSRGTPSVSAHHIHDYLHLVAALGADPTPVAPHLAVTENEVVAVARKFDLQTNPSRRILALQAGAEYGPAKRWPKERFIAAAVEVQRRTGCQWLILGGQSETSLAGEIAAGIEGLRSKSPQVQSSLGPLNLAGKTTLRELCALLKLCRALLTNDTGPMHVAAAVGTPVVALFGSTFPELTGPGMPGNRRHQLLTGQAACAPCFRRECPIDFRCMTSIPVEQVIEAVIRACGDAL